MKYEEAKRFKNVFIIVVLACTLVLTSVVSLHGLKKNRSVHVFDEMERILKLQVDLLTLEIEDQYIPLDSLADYISENDAEFGKGDVITISEVMRNVHRLCTIGFADKNGDCIDYEGNIMGNISDRDYFQNVIDGSCDNYITYLETTRAINEPRVLLSVPLYEDDEIVGVIFASKEIAILENALFLDEFFDKDACSFIVDSEGSIVAANDKTYEELEEGALFENYQGKSSDISQREILKSMVSNNDCDTCTNVLVGGKYYTHASIGIHDWVLFNMVDEKSVVLQYRDSESILINLILALVIILFVTVAIISIFFYMNQRRAKLEAETFRSQHESYRSLLYQMNCAVVEYNVQQDKVKHNQNILDVLEVKEGECLGNVINTLKKEHPEFNMKELRNQSKIAVEEYRTTAFESIVIKDNNEIQWFKLILMPIQDLDGTVTDVLVAVLDTTEYHQEFEASSRFMEIVPGGMHRCYLDDPIHLEYASEGLCKMLGYTMEEFATLVGNKYSIAIVEEDRPIFRDFVHELVQEEGTKTCEYRMICKDGSLLTVSDTMESKRNTDGVMYGYSVIVDLSEYKKEQEELELELSETKAQLLQARIANANSQMQPHFLYNALASIREIVLVDPEYASDLIFDFSTHLRACIRSMSNDNLVSFTQELDNIKAYVNIEQMRFGPKLKVAYDIEETDFEIIPLGLQPIVENAIRHGIYERGRAGGTVYIKTYDEDDNWVIQIADDGVGFDVQDIWQQIESGERDSTGLYNMVLRFEKQMRAKVDIRSEVGVGTKVTIYVPKGANNESNNRG